MIIHRNPLISLSLVLILSSLHGLASGQQANINDLLQQVEAKKSIVIRDLDTLEHNVEDEVQRIMVTFDEVIDTKIQPLFQSHYIEADTALKRVSLSADSSRLQIIWSQLKAAGGWGEQLKELCEGFAISAQKELKPSQEKLFKSINIVLQKQFTEELEKAQYAIRQPFDQILVRELPAWHAGRQLPLPPIPKNLIPESLETETAIGVDMPWTGLSALIVSYVIRTILRRMPRFIARKVLTKTVVKIIPVIGWALLAWDIFDISTAKSQLENQLRTTFVEEYSTHFTAEALWLDSLDENTRSFRGEIQIALNDSLNLFAVHVRTESRRVLDAANVLTISPHVERFISKQAEKGVHTKYIVDNLVLVWETFGPLVAFTPIETLLDMRNHFSGNEIVLRRLAEELGEKLVAEYEIHGPYFLQAARRIGVSTFVRMVRGEHQLDWREVIRALSDYPSHMNRGAVGGLLLLLEYEVAYQSFTPDALETVHQNEDLFRSLAPELPNTKTLLTIANTKWLRDTIAKAHMRNPQLTVVFAKTWEPYNWSRYEEDRQLDGLFAVADYRMKTGQTLQDFADELRDKDESTPIYVAGGIESLILWDAHVGHGAGDHQRKIAREAIDLYKAGYPHDALLTQQDMAFAKFCRNLPIPPAAGVFVHKILEPLGKAAPVIFYLIVILIIAAFVLPIVLHIYKRIRRIRPEPKRVFAPSYEVAESTPAAHPKPAVSEMVGLPPTPDSLEPDIPKIPTKPDEEQE